MNKYKKAIVTYQAKFGENEVYVTIDQDEKMYRTTYIGTKIEPGGRVASFVMRNSVHIMDIAKFIDESQKDFDEKFGKPVVSVDGDSMHKSNMVEKEGK